MLHELIMGTSKNRLFFSVPLQFFAFQAAKRAFQSGLSLKTEVFRGALITLRRRILLVLLLSVLPAGIFARENRHQGGDMLIGINFGFGITPNFFNLFTENKIPKGNYGLVLELGGTVDYYLFNWLSFNSGLLIRPGLYLLEDATYFNRPAGMPTWVGWPRDRAWYKGSQIPLSLTIPLMFHVNIPLLDILYVGAGVNFNIAVTNWFTPPKEPGMPDNINFKGENFFIGIPIDIGVDFIKSGRGGSRLLFRINPEFRERGTPVLLGILWQIYNFKVL